MNIGQIKREKLYFPSGPDSRWPEWDQVAEYIETYPDADYAHAPAASFDAFRKLRFGVRIHWGIYAMIPGLVGESWPFLRMTPAEKQHYQELYRQFNPVDFDAADWSALFAASGAQCAAFTAKHHDGFSLFHTATRVRHRARWTGPGGPALEACDLHYSVAETPFQRDIVRELTTALRARGLAIDLYFSHPDWYDADFRPFMYHPMSTPDAADLVLPIELEQAAERHGAPPSVFPAADALARQRMMARHRDQLLELVTNYGPIDMLCLDMWLGHEVWPQLRETVKLLRRTSPHTMLRARGIANYGDYHTPEGYVPGDKANTAMPWMTIYPLGSSFSYEQSADHHKGAAWMIATIVDCAAKGGAFMVGIGPDATGRFHPEARRQLLSTGEWLRRNGEAIYDTVPRPGDGWQEGENVRFTQSPDGSTVYAHLLRDPGDQLALRTLRPTDTTVVRLLSTGSVLDWRYRNDTLQIDLPGPLPDPVNVLRFDAPS